MHDQADARLATRLATLKHQIDTQGITADSARESLASVAADMQQAVRTNTLTFGQFFNLECQRRDLLAKTGPW